MSVDLRNFEEIFAADYMRYVYEYLTQDGVSHENPRHISAAMAYAKNRTSKRISSLEEEARNRGYRTDDFFGMDESHATATAIYAASDLAGLSIEEFHPYCQATSFIPALCVAYLFNQKLREAEEHLEIYEDDGAGTFFYQDILTSEEIRGI